MDLKGSILTCGWEKAWALQGYLAGELNNRYAHPVNLRRKKEKKPPCLVDRGRSCGLSSSYRLAQAQRMLLWTPFLPGYRTSTAFPFAGLSMRRRCWIPWGSCMRPDWCSTTWSTSLTSIQRWTTSKYLQKIQLRRQNVITYFIFFKYNYYKTVRPIFISSLP
jgi:hypothetical protein